MQLNGVLLLLDKIINNLEKKNYFMIILELFKNHGMNVPVIPGLQTKPFFFTVANIFCLKHSEVSLTFSI